MGDCHTFYDELRFDTRDPHLTHVYVYIRAQGDCPYFIQGWHHKAFPSTMSTHAIFLSLWNGEQDSDPVMWPMKAPPSYERDATLDEVTKVALDFAATTTISSGSMDNPLWHLARKIEDMKGG